MPIIFAEYLQMATIFALNVTKEKFSHIWNKLVLRMNLKRVCLLVNLVNMVGENTNSPLIHPKPSLPHPQRMRWLTFEKISLLCNQAMEGPDVDTGSPMCHTSITLSTPCSPRDVHVCPRNLLFIFAFSFTWHELF